MAAAADEDTGAAVVTVEEDTGRTAVAEDDARSANPRAAALAATATKPATSTQGAGEALFETVRCGSSVRVDAGRCCGSV